MLVSWFQACGLVSR